MASGTVTSGTARATDRIANVILSAALAFFSLDAIYAIYAGRTVYLPFVLTFVLILIASFRLRAEWRARFALTLLSSLFALYGAEIAITILTPMMSARNVWKAHHRFDFRSREEVIRDLRSHGVEAFQRVAAGFPIAGPGMTLGGSIANSTVVWCNETGSYVVYQTDEHGFRNPKGIWSAKPLQLAAVGDSFTNGACVDTGTDFISQIRSEYPATLNLGSGGAGPLEELAALEEYAIPLQPHIVLWCFFEGNDLEDLRQESAKPILMRYLRENGFRQQLRQRQYEIDNTMRPVLEQGLQWRSSILLVPSVGLRYYGKKSLLQFITLHGTHGLIEQFLQIGVKKDSWKTEEAEIGLLGEVLAKAANEVAGINGRLYFVFLPGADMFQNGAERLSLHDKVLQTVSALGISIIDVFPAFRAQGDPLKLYNVPFPHFNENGYKLTAQVIEQALASSEQTAARPELNLFAGK